MNLPGQMSPAPANSGPATMPQGNPGNAAAAMMKIKNGVHLFQEALPNLPMGSPLHEKILKVTTELVKELAETGENKALEMQELIKHVRSQGQQQPLSALSRLYPQQQQTPALPQASETPPAAAA